MLEILIPKCEKVPSSRTRRWLLCFMVLLLGTLMLSFYVSDRQLSWRSNLWRTWSSQSYNNTTTVYSISATERFFVPYPHHYRFIVDEPDRCRQQSPFLVLMIPVAPQNRDARDAIRRTWGKDTTMLGHVVDRYFLLGRTREAHGTEPLQEKVLQESQQHHDLVQSDFQDSYQNLTIKTMVMLEWLVSRCPGASYAMKIDSDMFLNVHNLVEMLLEAPRRVYMTGMVARSGPVLRDPNSKWFLPEEVFSESFYPPYALGLGYVFSLDLANMLIEASKHVRAVYIEDVYLGLCMRHLGIDPTDPPSSGLFMGPLPSWTTCYWNHVITTILESPQQLLDAWEHYQTEADC